MGKGAGEEMNRTRKTKKFQRGPLTFKRPFRIKNQTFRCVPFLTVQKPKGIRQRRGKGEGGNVGKGWREEE